MKLDTILQLTFVILALLTTVTVTYITSKFAAGMLSYAIQYGAVRGYSHGRPLDRRQRRCRSRQIHRPMFSYNNTHMRPVPDRWYRCRAVFMEDTIWSGGLCDKVHVP
jgi:hypothetical protein